MRNLPSKRHRSIRLSLICVAIVAIFAGFAIASHNEKKSLRQVSVKGEFLKPETIKGARTGEYTYKDDQGDWWVYSWVLSDNSAQNNYSSSSTLPRGGLWARGQAPTEEEVLAEEEENITETEVENSNNASETSEPSTDSDAEGSDSGSSSADSGGEGDAGGGDGD